MKKIRKNQKEQDFKLVEQFIDEWKRSLETLRRPV